MAENIRIVLDNSIGNWTVGEIATGAISGSTGTVKTWDSGGKILVVELPSAYFSIGENLVGASSGASGNVQSATNVYV